MSILVAVLGELSPANRLTAFDHGWVFMIVASALGVATAPFIGRVQRAGAPAGTVADPQTDLLSIATTTGARS